VEKYFNILIHVPLHITTSIFQLNGFVLRVVKKNGFTKIGAGKMKECYTCKKKIGHSKVKVDNIFYPVKFFCSKECRDKYIFSEAKCK